VSENVSHKNFWGKGRCANSKDIQVRVKKQERIMLIIIAISGKVVDMSEYLEEYEYKEKALKGQSGGSSVKKRKSYAVRTEPKPLPADDPLVSTTILEETLGKEMADALKTKEIITPEDFLRADYQSETSDLYQALVDGALVQADLFESTIKDQRDSVSQAVKSSKGFSTLNPDRAHSSFTRNVKKRRSTDPFDALSATSQAFLETVGVNSAEQFLSTRSTELALKFAEWREEQGKPALKGCGSIASISVCTFLDLHVGNAYPAILSLSRAGKT
jgi:tellurite resistance protein